MHWLKFSHNCSISKFTADVVSLLFLNPNWQSVKIEVDSKKFIIWLLRIFSTIFITVLKTEIRWYFLGLFYSLLEKRGYTAIFIQSGNTWSSILKLKLELRHICYPWLLVVVEKFCLGQNGLFYIDIFHNRQDFPTVNWI